MSNGQAAESTRPLPTGAVIGQSDTIVLSRPDRLGDVVIATAAIRPLLEQRPRTRVVFAARKIWLPLLRAHPLLADCIDASEPDETLTTRLRELAPAALVHLNPHAGLYRAGRDAGIPIRVGSGATARPHGAVRRAASLCVPDHCAVAAAPLPRAGRTDVADLGWLFGRAAGVVTRDTGPSHVAGAAGAPTVSICGRTQPVYGPVRWGALGTRVEMVVRSLPRRRFERKEWNWRRSFAAITPEGVFEALLRVASLP